MVDIITSLVSMSNRIKQGIQNKTKKHGLFTQRDAPNWLSKRRVFLTRMKKQKNGVSASIKNNNKNYSINNKSLLFFMARVALQNTKLEFLCSMSPGQWAELLSKSRGVV